MTPERRGVRLLFAATGDQYLASATVKPLRCRSLRRPHPSLPLGAAPGPTSVRGYEDWRRLGAWVDDLQPRAWGATDGPVVTAYGVSWLVGYEQDDAG